MRQVSLREFRTRGSSALQAVPEGETVLLAGQQGPAYFLIPVSGDVVAQDQELRRAMAKASLRRGWAMAKAAGVEPISDEDIDREVAKVRAARGVPRAPGSRRKRKPR
jgi:antitoxin (DNA-binding transcriptional repressor) of toxin-antitoxin stability system